MKKQVIAGVIAASLVLVGCNQGSGGSKASLDSDLQKVSYGIAHNIASNFVDQGIELDAKAFQKGLEEGLAGKASAVGQEDLMAAMQNFQQQQMEKQQSEISKLEEANAAEAKKFFAENAKKEGVSVTESGLQYSVVSASGKDQKPGIDDTVVVHYRGTLLNGEEFDSSYSRNQPATFGLSHVIPGWTEALQLMNVGDKFQIFIPSELAYGAGGAGPKIGPNAALIFEVELLDINPTDDAEADVSEEDTE